MILNRNAVERFIATMTAFGLELVEPVDWSTGDAILNASDYSPSATGRYTFGCLQFRKTAERHALERPQVAYLVSSHFSYQALTLPVLLLSMISAARIEPARIYVTVCGCTREFDMTTQQGTFWFVNHESRNFCNFIEAINPVRAEQMSPFSPVFCLLDTSKVGPKFGALTGNFDGRLDAIAVEPFPFQDRIGARSDLAAYRLDYLRTQATLIETFRNAHWSIIPRLMISLDTLLRQ